MDINNIKLENSLSLIEASAGTGKSFTLSHMVLRTIFEKRINPENILLLSFTNNTCNELRTKIEERIIKLENYITNNKEDNIDITLINWYKDLIKNIYKENNIIPIINNIKNDINKLTITTFHGFCKKIIDDYNIELSTPLSSHIDNNIDQLYIDIINDLWIEEYFHLDSEIIKSIENKKISTKYNNKEINIINKKLFIKLLKEIDQENIYEYKINDIDKGDINEFLKEYLFKAWEEFCKEWHNNGENLFNELVKFGKSIEEKGFKSRIYSGNPRNKYIKIKNWIDNININFTKSNINKIIYEISKDDLLSKYFYSKTILKENKKYHIDIDLSNFNKLQNKIYNLKDGFFNEFIRIFLSKSKSRLIKLKEKLNILNYSDLIKIIQKKYLTENKQEERSLTNIKNKYKCILIDEFQDTDNIQWNIIKKLFNDKEHFLLCVGDPKQAIYKFRGGDIKTYLNAKRDSVEIYTLKENYRTSEKLINIINCLYRKGLLNSELKHPRLIAKNKSTINYGSAFKIIEFSKREINLEQYLINYLKQLLLNHNEIELERIAILTLYNYQCSEIKNILLENDLSSNLVNKNNIFDTESSRLLELFINCLVNPYSLRNIILLITSKFIQIDVEQIEHIENSKEIDLISQRCKIWSNTLKEKGFINLVNELISHFRSPLIINNNDLMINLFQLSEIIENELIKSNYDLNNLINWYQNELNIETRKMIGEEFLIKNYDQNQGINISTIHSSKGLEFDIVICPYLWDIKKSPIHSKGPIWKNSKSKEIYINIEESHHKVQNLKLIEDKDSTNESERLIYVALTRAKYKLIVFNNIDNEDNILNNNLLSNLTNKEKYLLKDSSNLNDKEFTKQKIKNYQNSFKKNPWNISKKQNIQPTENSINKINLRSSYSSWINKNINFQSNIKDYQNKISLIKNISISNKKNSIYDLYKEANPLSYFPKGKNAGICLHKILERYNFNSMDLESLRTIIKEELRNYDIDNDLSECVEEGILRVVNISLGEKLQNKRLIDIPSSNVIKELRYDLAISKSGLIIKSEDIAECFCIDKDYDFAENYSKKIKDLKIFSTGFHSGFIDCIIPIGENLQDSKWWILDWKSNFISEDGISKCLPQNYNYEIMKAEMINHHYPLQSHLYLLALHRLLKWRLKKYNPLKNLGGYVYIFLRGLPEALSENKNLLNVKTPGIFIGSAPIKRINYLDSLFKDERN